MCRPLHASKYDRDRSGAQKLKFLPSNRAGCPRGMLRFKVLSIQRESVTLLLVKTSWTFMYENSALLVRATENGQATPAKWRLTCDY
jgi:hypothetical protein